MKIVIGFVLLFLSIGLPLSAQSQEDAFRSINESTAIGIGGYNLRDTYLSPSTDINYTGWVARVLNERMKIVKLADYKVSRQQIINIEFGSTLNGAGTASEYAGFADYSLGYHYRFTSLLPGLKVLTGVSTRLSGGFIYNTRNSNNPVSGKLDWDMNLSAMVIYNFQIKKLPLTFRYQTEIPFMGVLFSVHKGEPYYFLSQGDHDGVVRFSSFHNKFAMKNYFSLDVPISNFTLRVGYLNSIYRTDVNGIHTHILSNSFMIGWVKEFVSFGGKKLKERTHQFQSAYY